MRAGLVDLEDRPLPHGAAVEYRRYHVERGGNDDDQQGDHKATVNQGSGLMGSDVWSRMPVAGPIISGNIMDHTILPSSRSVDRLARPVGPKVCPRSPGDYEREGDLDYNHYRRAHEDRLCSRSRCRSVGDPIRLYRNRQGNISDSGAAAPRPPWLAMVPMLFVARVKAVQIGLPFPTGGVVVAHIGLLRLAD